MVSSVSSSQLAGNRRHATPLVSHDCDRTVVWLDGEHDIATVSILTDTLAAAISADDADVIVDLSGVTFMGTATIEVLVRSRDALGRKSRTLTVRSPSRCAKRVLELCGLSGLIEERS